MEAKPPLQFRKLRIAWSVAWGVAAVLLVLAWVRSYWYMETIQGQLSNGWAAGIAYAPGYFTGFYSSEPATGKFTWTTISLPTDVWRSYADPLAPPPPPGWLTFAIRHGGFAFPCWFSFSIVTAFAAAPWLLWKFSLRTLLIATTLAAVGLGLLVFAVRK